jgi:hypothetical protein
LRWPPLHVLAGCFGDWLAHVRWLVGSLGLSPFTHIGGRLACRRWNPLFYSVQPPHRFRSMDHGSCSWMVHGSWIMVNGSWSMDQGPRFNWHHGTALWFPSMFHMEPSTLNSGPWSVVGVCITPIV